MTQQHSRPSSAAYPDLRFEHVARRVVESRGYFCVFTFAVVLAWLDNMLLALGSSLVVATGAFLILPRTAWGRDQGARLGPRSRWTDPLCLTVGLIYLALATFGWGPAWSEVLARVLLLGFLVPRLLHWLHL